MSARARGDVMCRGRTAAPCVTPAAAGAPPLLCCNAFVTCGAVLLPSSSPAVLARAPPPPPSLSQCLRVWRCSPLNRCRCAPDRAARGCRRYYSARGNAYRALGQYQRAFFDYSAAARIEPTNGLLFCHRAAVLRRLRRFREALEDVDRALDLEATNATFFFNKGLILFEMGDLEQAVSQFSAAITFDRKLHFKVGGDGAPPPSVPSPSLCTISLPLNHLRPQRYPTHSSPVSSPAPLYALRSVIVSLRPSPSLLHVISPSLSPSPLPHALRRGLAAGMMRGEWL